MPRRRLFRAAALVVTVGGVAAVPAIAATSAPSKATLHTVGKPSFKINQYAQDGSHFDKSAVTIKSGGTLTVADKTGIPHTFTLVTKKQLPKSASQILGDCKICDTIGAGHQLDANGNPTVLTVDPGNDGFNQSGDSQVIIPKKSVKLKITAKKGTTLYYMCLIHPWMQGKLTVK
jgi:plastocyanin